MTYRTKLILIAVLFAVVAGGALWYLRADYIGICAKGNRSCYDTLDPIMNVLFLMGLGVAPVLFILAFLSKDVFVAWFKFARVYIPFFVLLIIFDDNGGGNSLGIESGEIYGSLLGFVYFVVSIVILVRAHRRLKRQQTQSSNPFPTGGQKSA
jgi:hypothetical protein